MRVSIKIRLKVGCGIGAERDDSSAQFFSLRAMGAL